jgi:LssY C-terminus
VPICIIVTANLGARLREMPEATMIDRRAMKRSLLRRALVCLVVVGGSCLLPKLSTAGQADPTLALIDVIRQAGREKTAAAFLQQIEAADKLVPSADMAAVDARKRTALHWSVLSGQSASSAQAKDACRRLVEDLLAAGADVNAEDAYGNTPLDYQVRSPAGLLEDVLIEQGGLRGYTQTAQARVLHLLDQVRAAERDNDLQRLRSLLESDLPANTELSVRLLTRVASHESRAGDAVEAVVIAPVEAGGRTVVAPGTKVEGTVLRARRASTRYEQAQLDIDFCNLVHDGGGTTPVAALLTEVDNAREQVRDGQIVGISFPQAASDRLSWGRSAVGFVHPLLGHALQAAILAWQKGYGREIVLPAGTDVFVRIMAPEKLAAIPGGAVAAAETPAGLADIARLFPTRTTTAGNVPSDLVNILLVGSRTQVEGAFESAGWSPAQKLGVTSGLKTFASAAQQTGYAEAPVSLLLLDGRKPDLVYQKQTNTFARRHHIRVWKSPQSYEGCELWLGAGTHDIGIAVLKGGHAWYHLVDSRIDREQAKVKDDLLFTGRVGWFSWLDRPGVPRRSVNGTGDELRTEGRLLVLWLANPRLPGRARPSGG